MKKFLKGTGMVLLALVSLSICFYAFIYWAIEKRVNKTYQFSREEVQVLQDPATISRGAHLIAIRGCTDCHGSNLGGKIIAEDPMLGRLVGPNLTSGKGGKLKDYSTADWLMAFRHGVNRNGKPLVLMPSYETNLFTSQDLGAIIAYLKQVPPVDNEPPAIKLGPIARTMTFLGKMPLFSVEMIDHTNPLNSTVDSSNEIATGKYMGITCSGCHRPTMKGGPGLTPDMLPVPDISGTGATGHWSLAQFKNALRTGVKASGAQMDPAQMPWKTTANYTDEEMNALYAYLKTM